MRRALSIGAKDLRQRLRDRSALGVAFGLPLLLASVIGFSLGGADDAFRMRLGVVGSDARSQAFETWVRALDYTDGVGLVPVASTAAAESLLRDEELDAAVVFPDSGPARVLAEGGNAFSARMSEGLVARFVAGREEAPATDGRSPGGRLRTLDFFAASMAVLFLNFGVLSGVRALQGEKDVGTLSRLAASPVSAGAILTGKFGALLMLGLLQMAMMIGATGLLFGTTWGAPLPVAVLSLTTVLTSVGMMCFFVSIADNAESGGAIAGISIFLLAIVGGQFLPPQGLPDVFDTLQRLTPNGQAFRGFTDIAAAGPDAGLGVVAEPLLVTTAVGVAGIAFASFRARRTLERA